MANEMPAEIDFRGGQRGKHHPAYIQQPGQTTGNTTVPDLLAALDALMARAVEAEHDALAYRGALGYPMPGSHNGRLTDGTLPNNGIAHALEIRLAEVERALTIQRALCLSHGEVIDAQKARIDALTAALRLAMAQHSEFVTCPECGPMLRAALRDASGAG